MTAKATYDVLGVGNAIVDMISPVLEDFLTRHDIARSGMTLIDQDRAEYLTAAFGDDVTQTSGGSAANTIAGIASFGLKAAYIGKTADDALGKSFRDGMQAIGVHYGTPPLKDGPSTARCIIAVTPDGERSMSTFLGASPFFSKEDLDAKLIEESAIVFLEGYLFDRDEAKAAFARAAELAAAAGRKVALTLSDGFCVDRHRASFRQLVKNHVDILFANEAEILSLYQVSDFPAAVAEVRKECALAALTRSEKGSAIVTGDKVIEVAVDPVPHVVDATGAGDLYAAGFLSGFARGRPLEECGRLGAIAAAEVISHFGPRPETSLKALAAKKGVSI
jgi:sugar/nucleoside kinase (ribokinase family)